MSLRDPYRLLPGRLVPARRAGMARWREPGRAIGRDLAIESGSLDGRLAG